MPFTGNEGAPIAMSQAVQLTTNYRNAHPGEIKCHFFGMNILQQLLHMPGAVGIRIYHGQDSAGNRQLVLVAADANEKDIQTLVADFSIPCPHNCDSVSPLAGNTDGGGPIVG